MAITKVKKQSESLMLLHHFPLCPFSRKVRLMLSEIGVDFDLVEEKFWLKKTEFMLLNPIGSIPFIVMAGKIKLAHSWIICDFIAENFAPQCTLYPADYMERLEMKRLLAWFDEKMSNEVTIPILYEKVINFFSSGAEPDYNTIIAARKNCDYHIKYICHLLKRQRWLASDTMSLADLACASHISVLDYLHEINWSKVPDLVKDWYSLIKSRKSFQDILSDSITGFAPPSCYLSVDVA